MTQKSSPIATIEPRKRKKITLTYLENAGAYYLERFSASSSQFRKVMGRKIDLSCRDHPDQQKTLLMQDLERVIEKFTSLGYLDDKRYGQALAQSLKSRGYPLARLIMTLRQKGLDENIIESVLPEHTTDDDKQAALHWAKRKRLGPYATREYQKDKHLGSLARAGFGYEISNWVLNLSRDEADILL